MKLKRIFTRNFFHSIAHIRKELNTLAEGFDKGVFLRTNNVSHKALLGFEFRKYLFELSRKHWNQLENKRLTNPQRIPSIPNRSTQNSTNDISTTFIRRRRAISNCKTHSSHMICDHPHGNICFLLVAVGNPCTFRDRPNQSLEDIGIIIGGFPLKNGANPLKSHSSIHMLRRKRLQGTVFESFELNENKVPNLHHARIICVHQTGTRCDGSFLVGTEVNMEFRARPTGSGLPHFPEIILLPKSQDMIFRNGRFAGP